MSSPQSSESRAPSIDWAVRTPDEFDILSTYARAIGMPALIQEGLTVAGYVHDFGGQKASAAELRHVALLSPIAAGLETPETRSEALAAFDAYRQLHSAPTWKYLTDMTTDLPLVDELAARRRHDGSYDTNENLARVMRATSYVQFDSSAWLEPAILPTGEELVDLLKVTNIASAALIGSGRMYNSLQDESSNVLLLQRATDVRSFFGPLGELTGFDASSMCLRGICNVLAAKKSGNSRLVDTIMKKQTDVTNADDVAQMNTELLKQLLGTTPTIQSPISDTIGHGTIFHTLHDIGEGIRGVSRVKSVGGQIRSAIDKYPGLIDSPDKNGITIIVEKRQMVAEVYAQIVKQVLSSGLRLNTPPRKGSPFVLRGRSTFTQPIQLACERSSANVDFFLQNKPYEVAKLYFINKQGQPTEIQVVDEAQRARGRVDKDESHFAYRAGEDGSKTEFSATQLKWIHALRDKINSATTVPASKQRGAELRAAVEMAQR